jgi:DNA-binding transcriptional LysR family regulator
MDVKQLEAFRSVVDRRSVTAAAQAVGLTQPAVSAQIARLEATVGFALFERVGRNLKPTPEGLLFYAEATRVLDELDRLQATTERIRQGELGRLVIASHPWASTALLPQVVAGFLSRRPGVEMRLIARHSDVISQLLNSESFDVGIAEAPIDSTALSINRHSMRCVAILPADHPLRERTVLTPALLSGLPMVGAARNLQLQTRVAEVFSEAGAQARSVVEAELFASMCALVGAGVGWALVDPLSARRFEHLGIVVRPFRPAVNYEICVFHHRDREPSRLASSFIELLEAELDSLA